ncbi:MAG: DUF4215 domain-containing protein, partial [Myxococcales bacterium]|nr:DUF4215 domain-containing protein [Myxococcales bacterium]
MVTGMSDGDTTFGGTFATGDLARGASAGGVGTGGLYAFDVAAGDPAFGWQPGTNDFTPGTAVVRFVNDTGAPIVDPTVRYEVWILNDQPRANDVAFGYSTDGVTFTPVPALTVTSVEAADATPAWTMTPETITLTGVTIPAAGTLALAFSGDDVSGGGNRDEFAIDDIVVSFPGCGDGLLQPGEACDDGNDAAGDGCDAACTVEHGFACAGEPSACASSCGDGVVASDEGCDDGDTADGDGCDAT